MTNDDLHARLARWWDDDADTYDSSASHAGTDPVEQAAWRAAVLRALPPAPASVLDAGAGTGTLSLLAAELGYTVTSLDLSPRMLARAEQKAAERGLSLTTVVGPATEPPEGPFDAVVARHLVWTLPDPVAALTAWHAVAPEGRLVLFEGLWADPSTMGRARREVTRALRSATGAHAHDHHGEYDPDVTASLPLASQTTPQPMLAAVEEAGWRRIRIERLPDVEWARRLAEPPVIGALAGRPQFAITADA